MHVASFELKVVLVEDMTHRQVQLQSFFASMVNLKTLRAFRGGGYVSQSYFFGRVVFKPPFSALHAFSDVSLEKCLIRADRTYTV